MPPKTVKCSICNETVLKSKTFALSDGTRACRSHKGVEEEAKKLYEQNKERLGKLRERGQIGIQEEVIKFREEGLRFRKEANIHCWTCGVKGKPVKEYFAECVIAIERLKIRGELNILTLNKDINKLMGNPIVLFLLPYYDERDKEIYCSIRNNKVKNIIHFIKQVNMCKECVNKFHINDRLENLLPQPTWEQMVNMMPVMGLLESDIRKMAEEKEKLGK